MMLTVHIVPVCIGTQCPFLSLYGPCASTSNFTKVSGVNFL